MASDPQSTGLGWRDTCAYPDPNSGYFECNFSPALLSSSGGPGWGRATLDNELLVLTCQRDQRALKRDCSHLLNFH